MRRSSDGRGQAQDAEGAWAPSEEWWSDKQEIAMCHEIIGEFMSSREELTLI